MNQTSVARTEDPPALAAPEAAMEATGSGSFPAITAATPAPERTATKMATAPTTTITMFAGFMAGGLPARARRFRALMVIISVAVHGAALAAGAAASFWTVEELSPPRLPVTFLARPVAPPPPPPAARRAAERPRPRPVRQPVAVRRELIPPPSEQAADQDEGAGEAQGTAGGVAGGVVGAVSAAPPPRMPELSPQERQALIRQYLERVVAPRILSRLRMPPEAERLGIEGRVILHVSIDGSGRVLGLRPVGACAFEILCEDAARTIREAAPFPAPPPALAEGVLVDVPLNYRLQ